MSRVESFLSKTGSNIQSRVDLTKGTLAWSVRAIKKAKEDQNFINATIGSVTNDDGSLMVLSTLNEVMSNKLNGDKLFGYANVRGINSFIDAWKKETISTYPLEFQEKARQMSSTPVPVSGGLTGGLFVVGAAFFDEATPLISPRARWGNIDNVYYNHLGVPEITFTMFDDTGKLSWEGVKESLDLAVDKYEKIGLMLNFPNNPMGYAPNLKEIDELIKIIKNLSTPTILLLDDAYEGYVYEKEGLDHSLFPHILGLNENVLPIKVDGPSKRYFAYGTRLGVVTLEKTKADKEFDVREFFAKVARSVSSSAPRGIQEALGYILSNEELKNQIRQERQEAIAILKERYLTFKKELKNYQSDNITPVNSNAGFFGFFILNGLNASEMGFKLLKKGLGTVPFYNEQTGLNGVRVAFCSVPKERIPEMVKTVYETAKSMK
jgi:aspartate/tyrosine/aromatic aminotransferase